MACDNDIIRGGLGLVTDKTKKTRSLKKIKNRAFLNSFALTKTLRNI